MDSSIIKALQKQDLELNNSSNNSLTNLLVQKGKIKIIQFQIITESQTLFYPRKLEEPHLLTIITIKLRNQNLVHADKCIYILNNIK